MTLAEAKAAGVVGPAHLTLEVVNALLVKSRRGSIDDDYRSEAIRRLGAYGILVDTPRDPSAVIERVIGLADRHRLTAYDAAYLELAQRMGATLASFDGDLRRAAEAEGVPVRPK